MCKVDFVKAYVCLNLRFLWVSMRKHSFRGLLDLAPHLFVLTTNELTICIGNECSGSLLGGSQKQSYLVSIPLL